MIWVIAALATVLMLVLTWRSHRRGRGVDSQALLQARVRDSRAATIYRLGGR